MDNSNKINHSSNPKYTLILPCKDEEKTIGICIEKAYSVIDKKDLEIIVVDNNSQDKSAKIAASLGAKVVKETIPGYGAAILKGISVAQGKHIILCDADNTYDLEELPNLLKYVQLSKNRKYDIVIGNRFNKNMAKGSMNFLHKHVGNPILSFILRTFYKIKVQDAHCGLRVIRSEVLKDLNLQSTGMEFASEMLLKAGKKGLKIKEVDIHYGKRIGKSKLHSFRDGWKHLRLMLLYSPDNLYLVPAVTTLSLGIIIFILMLQGPISITGLKFYIHPTFIASMLILLGFQIMLLWIFSKTYMITYLGDEDTKLEKVLSHLSLEKGVIIGIIILLIGIAIHLKILLLWISTDFGKLNDINSAILGLTLIIIGIQTIFSSFYLSILGMKNEQK